MITWSGMIRQPCVLCALGVNTGLPSKGQRRGGTTVYRQAGPLSKGQRRGGNTVYRHSGLLPKDGRRGGATVYRHSGPLSKGQRGGWRQCTGTQDLYLKVRGEIGDRVQKLRTAM